MYSFFNRIEKEDITILKIFNSSIRCRILDILMPTATYLGSFLFCFLFCITTLLNKDQYIHLLGIKTTASSIVGSIIVRIIKVTVNRIRPYIKFDNLNLTKIGIDKYSFPSGHTTAAFSIAVMLSLFMPSFSMLFLSVAVCVGISRMYLGVHYPTDIVAGIILGTLCSVMVYYL